MSQNGEKHGTCNVIGPVGKQNVAFSIPPCIFISHVTKTGKELQTDNFLKFKGEKRGLELFCIQYLDL